MEREEKGREGERERVREEGRAREREEETDRKKKRTHETWRGTANKRRNIDPCIPERKETNSPYIT